MNVSNAHNGLNKVMHKVIELEKWLDEQEKVSLVFLLCDDVLKAQFILAENLVSDPRPTDVLTKLLDYVAHSGNKHKECKIVESLILIGNYKIVSLLGYSKCEIDKLKEMYRKSEHQHYINTVRKVLLRICENMSDGELMQLMCSIECDFVKQNSHFINYGSKLMELNFLFCISQGYISDGIDDKCDVSNLVRLLKKMRRDDLADKLDKAEKNTNQWCSMILQKDDDSMGNILSVTSTCVVHNETHYEMDKANMGLCVIVNQRNFSEKWFKRSSSIMSDRIRHGTDNDREMLKITFTGLGYNIIILENLDSSGMEKSIRRIVKQDVKEKHSSLVLCILSHGKRGAVYGVDGVEVPVEKIEKWILGDQCPKLLSKPKILIIQACQGNDLQIAQPCPQDVNDNLMLECDGPSYHVPPNADLFTFWATVEGYASFRHPCSGSVFIQTLCFELLKLGHKDHFGDIATSVNNQLSGKFFGCDNKVTVSQVKHTTRKKLFFPYCSETRLKTATLLFEKYLIQALITESICKIGAYQYWSKNRKLRDF